MAVFMIVPTEDPQRLERLVCREFPEEKDRYILPGKQACYVKFSGTTKELSEKLDLQGIKKEGDRPCPAVITIVTGYGGYAPSALWEWLNSRMGG